MAQAKQASYPPSPSKEVSQTSMGYGLGCGTSARPPLGQNRKDILAPRKLEVKGWVSECSTRQVTDLDDDQVTGVLDQLAEFMTKEAKG